MSLHSSILTTSPYTGTGQGIGGYLPIAKTAFESLFIAFRSDHSQSGTLRPPAYLLTSNFALWSKLFKGAITFYREGGASVCDGRSPIFSGPPLWLRQKIVVPPFAYGVKFWSPPLTSWKNFGPPPPQGERTFPLHKQIKRQWSDWRVPMSWGLRKNVIIFEHVMCHEVWLIKGFAVGANLFWWLYLKRKCANCTKKYLRKNFGPPLLDPQKILVPPFDPLTKFWSPPLTTQKNSGPPPTNRRPPLPVINDSSLSYFWIRYKIL